MDSNYFELGVLLSVRDMMGGVVSRVTGNWRDLRGELSLSETAADRVERSMSRISRAAATVTAGLAIGGIAISMATSGLEASKLEGNIRSLGMTNTEISSIREETALMSAQFGIAQERLLTGVYDIKSAVSDLDNASLAGFTRAVEKTTLATKGQFESQAKTFGMITNQFRDKYRQLDDVTFARNIGNTIAWVGKMFRAEGPSIDQALTSMGSAGAVAGLKFEEQMAVVGRLLNTMDAGTAGTSFRQFISRIPQAEKTLGLRFRNPDKSLKSVADILGLISNKYRDLNQSSEVLTRAFSEEGVKLIKELVPHLNEVKTDVQDIQRVSASGNYKFLEEMSAANISPLSTTLDRVKFGMAALWSSMGVGVGDNLNRILAPVADLIERLNRLDPATKANIGRMVALSAAVVTGYGVVTLFTGAWSLWRGLETLNGMSALQVMTKLLSATTIEATAAKTAETAASISDAAVKAASTEATVANTAATAMNTGAKMANVSAMDRALGMSQYVMIQEQIAAEQMAANVAKQAAIEAAALAEKTALEASALAEETAFRTASTFAINRATAAEYSNILAKRISVTTLGYEKTALGVSTVLHGVLSGQITMLTAAQWAWNTAMAASPLLLFTGIVVALGAAAYGTYWAYNRLTDEWRKPINLNSEGAAEKLRGLRTEAEALGVELKGLDARIKLAEGKRKISDSDVNGWSGNLKLENGEILERMKDLTELRRKFVSAGDQIGVADIDSKLAALKSMHSMLQNFAGGRFFNKDDLKILESTKQLRMIAGLDTTEIDLAIARVKKGGSVYFDLDQTVMERVRISMGQLSSAAGLMLTGAADAISRDWDRAMKALDHGIDEWVNGLYDKGKKGGRGLITAFISGMNSVAGLPAGSIEKIFGGIASLMPHSDADRGPLSRITASGRALPETFAQGMESGLGSIAPVSLMMAQNAAPELPRAIPMDSTGDPGMQMKGLVQILIQNLIGGDLVLPDGGGGQGSFDELGQLMSRAIEQHIEMQGGRA